MKQILLGLVALDNISAIHVRNAANQTQEDFDSMAREYNKDINVDEMKDNTLLLSQPVLQFQNSTIQITNKANKQFPIIPIAPPPVAVSSSNHSRAQNTSNSTAVIQAPSLAPALTPTPVAAPATNQTLVGGLNASAIANPLDQMLESAMNDFQNTQAQFDLMNKQMTHQSPPEPPSNGFMSGLNLIAAGPVLSSIAAPQKVEQPAPRVEDTYYSPENMPLQKMQESAAEKAAKQAAIQKTLEVVRQNEEKKMHPLGGHLGDLFKDVSDKLIVSQSAPEIQTVESSFFDLKKPNETQNQPNLAEQQTSQQSGAEVAQRSAVVQKTLDLYKSNQVIKKTLDKVRQEELNKAFPKYELPADEKLKIEEKKKAKEALEAIEKAKQHKSTGSVVQMEQPRDEFDPDEYRLRHPFSGAQASAKTMASTINNWETGNEIVYKLEQNRLNEISMSAAKTLNQAYKNMNKSNETQAIMQVQAPTKIASIERPKPFTWTKAEEKPKTDKFENAHQFQHNNHVKKPLEESHPIKSFFRSIGVGLSNIYHKIFSLGFDHRQIVKFNELPKLKSQLVKK